MLLLQRFGSAKAALDAPVEQIATIVRHKQAAESWRNGEKRALAQKAAEAALQWEKQDGCRLLLLQDDDFPEMLTQGITAPPVLFYAVMQSCCTHLLPRLSAAAMPRRRQCGLPKISAGR